MANPSSKDSPLGSIGPLSARIANRQQSGGFAEALGVLFGKPAAAAVGDEPPEPADGEEEHAPGSQPAGLNRGALLSRLQGSHRAHLNRGFYALLDAAQPSPPGEDRFAAYEQMPASEFRVVMVDSDCVEPNPFLPPFAMDTEVLDLLARGVREQGILEPVHVIPSPEPGPDGRQHYWVILGERHRQAAVHAGVARLPVILREVSPRAGLQMFLAQYVHTRPMAILVRAQVYEILTGQMGMTVEEVAERVGISAEQVTCDLALLQLDEPIKDSLRQGRLSPDQARALLRATDPEARAALWHYALRYNPSPERIAQRLLRIQSAAV